MIKESRKFRRNNIDKPKLDSGKVPNSNKKGFVQGQSCTDIPYIRYLLVQSRKMSPYQKGKTGDGNASCIEVVFDILVYVGISCEYTGGRSTRCSRVFVVKTEQSLPRQPLPLDPTVQMSPLRRRNLERDQSPITLLQTRLSQCEECKPMGREREKWSKRVRQGCGVRKLQFRGQGICVPAARVSSEVESLKA